MIRLAYVANTFFSPSETFVRDLAIPLAERYDVTVVASAITESGRRERIAKTIESPLNTNRIWARLHRQATRLIAGDVDACQYRQQESLHRVRRETLLDKLSPDIIFCDYGTNGVLLSDYCTSRNLPLVVHFHGYDLSSALASASYRGALRRLADSKARIIVPSEHMARLFTIATGAARRTTTIPYGPDLRRLDGIMKALTSGPQQSALIAVGRMTAKKNPLALVEAFRLVRKKYAEARLDWLGDGELLQAARTRTREHGLEDAVTFHGAKPHDEVVRLMSQSAVFVQHSCTAPNGDQEGMPVAILEARSLGLPIVSTWHRGIPEAVAGYPNVALVQEHDYVAMAAHIKNFLETRPPTPPRAVRHLYNLEDRIERVCAIINDCLDT
jgi:colanic acid/amylovoran biosynthesis glycosyltransferase